LNGLGFVINCDWEKILALEVLELCNKTTTPLWLIIAGPHGEFEVLFTILTNKVNEFLATAHPKA
jgi:hypothetical protein